MRLGEVLVQGRILVDADGERVKDKSDALRLLAGLLASAAGTPEEDLERMFRERETLQSTGIGDGVAIPHTAVDGATTQAGALILCPRGIPFDSIDGGPCNIVFGVVGPKGAAGEHLRLLARISRLLRDAEVRRRLAASSSSEDAYRLIVERDGVAAS